MRPRTIFVVVFWNTNRSMINNPISVRTIAAAMAFQLSQKTIWRGFTREGIFTYRRLKKTVCQTAYQKVKLALCLMDHIG